MLTALDNRIRQRFKDWVDRRIPRHKSVTLTQRRIFIFPSKPGLWFCVILLLMLLAAINYQSNMAFALVFLLVSVFVISILHTYANLSGLTISVLNSPVAFAGDMAEIVLKVSRQGNKDYFDINLSWPNSEERSVTLIKNNEEQLTLHLPVEKRGLYRAERLLVETYYPVGLLRCWTWLDLDVEAIVYPKPLISKRQGYGISEQTGEGDLINVVGSDDFYQFNEYHPGDSLKHVFWKSFAKGQDLQTKQYAAYRDQRVWLDYNQFTGGIEERLSKLCYWVLQLEKTTEDYGLRLPGLEVQPNHGKAHQAQLLKALALFKGGG